MRAIKNLAYEVSKGFNWVYEERFWNSRVQGLGFRASPREGLGV